MANVNILLASSLCKRARQADYDGIAPTYTSPKYKGDGQLKVSNGLHTVSISLHSFVGNIYIQGTLKTNPTEDDWVNIWLESPNAANYDRTNGIICPTATSRNDIYIFYGNFFWVRAKVDPYNAGTVNYIRLTF